LYTGGDGSAEIVFRVAAAGYEKCPEAYGEWPVWAERCAVEFFGVGFAEDRNGYGIGENDR
jgi:hypothetical protein